MRLECELTYFEAVAQHINHCATETILSFFKYILTYYSSKNLTVPFFMAIVIMKMHAENMDSFDSLLQSVPISHHSL